MVLEVVIGLLEEGGYDAVQVREVAKRAQISLTTLYKLYGGRDAVIVAALSEWMERSVYSQITEPEPGVSLHDGLMALYRQLFQLWGRNPRMLEAYHRARSTRAGRVLDQQGVRAVVPPAQRLLDRADAAYADDVALVLSLVFDAVVGRFARGQLSIDAILPTLDRTLHRLTADNARWAGAPSAGVGAVGADGPPAQEGK